MNRQELVNNVAAKANISKKQAADVLALYLDEITAALAKGDKVQFIGFGTFSVKDKPARTCRNPQDPAKKIKIAACKAPAFKAGAALKTAVNAKKAKKK